MAEYDAIEDIPSSVSAVSKPASSSQPAPIYNLQGQRQDMLHHGVNIVGNQKKMVK
jgi:hypothetical protein